MSVLQYHVRDKHIGELRGIDVNNNGPVSKHRP